MLEENDTPLEEHDHDEKELIFSLSRNEALFLDDSLTLMVEREGDDQRIYSMRPVQMTAGLAVPLDLMDKIGKAIVYTTKPENQGKEYIFPVDITELFMLREVSSSFIRIGDEPVGYTLKRKICNLLYDEDINLESRNIQVDQLLKDVNVDFDATLSDEVDTPIDKTS
jgi:hypothetical protein